MKPSMMNVNEVGGSPKDNASPTADFGTHSPIETFAPPGTLPTSEPHGGNIDIF